jgi:hypothetical protein
MSRLIISHGVIMLTILREENDLREKRHWLCFDKKVLRVSGLGSEDVTGDWRKLHSGFMFCVHNLVLHSTTRHRLLCAEKYRVT